MCNESGLDEFVLWVNGGVVFCMDRSDHESEWQTFAEYGTYDDGGTVVKAYGSPDWQMEHLRDEWFDAVIIGYQERRLTPTEEWHIRYYVSHYWDIPF